MNKTWNCNLTKQAQTTVDDSFIGGTPKLPFNSVIPICTLCHHKMTFMFQIAFPEGHIWSGKTLALFFCTDCSGGEYCIPEMPEGGPLYQIEIPKGFLDTYQRNFRVLVFDTNKGIIQQNYSERIPFLKLAMEQSDDTDGDAIFALGGEPIWIMEQDETPGSYAGSEKLKLLFQIQEDFNFPRIESAQPQASDFTPNKLSLFPWYYLFAGDRIYFWGTECLEDPKVYISVQTH